MTRALSLLFSFAFSALVIAGCQGAAELPAHPLRGPQAVACELDLRDSPCISCLKARCCTQAKACSNDKVENNECPCARKCIGTDNTRTCAEGCAAPAQDRAMALCAADACANECPGGRR